MTLTFREHIEKIYDEFIDKQEKFPIRRQEFSPDGLTIGRTSSRGGKNGRVSGKTTFYFDERTISMEHALIIPEEEDFYSFGTDEQPPALITDQFSTHGTVIWRDAQLPYLSLVPGRLEPLTSGSIICLTLNKSRSKSDDFSPLLTSKVFLKVHILAGVVYLTKFDSESVVALIEDDKAYLLFNDDSFQEVDYELVDPYFDTFTLSTELDQDELDESSSSPEVELFLKESQYDSDNSSYNSKSVDSPDDISQENSSMDEQFQEDSSSDSELNAEEISITAVKVSAPIDTEDHQLVEEFVEEEEDEEEEENYDPDFEFDNVQESSEQDTLFDSSASESENSEESLVSEIDPLCIYEFLCSKELEEQDREDDGDDDYLSDDCDAYFDELDDQLFSDNSDLENDVKFCKDNIERSKKRSFNDCFDECDCTYEPFFKMRKKENGQSFKKTLGLLATGITIGSVLTFAGLASLGSSLG